MSARTILLATTLIGLADGAAAATYSVSLNSGESFYGTITLTDSSYAPGGIVANSDVQDIEWTLDIQPSYVSLTWGDQPGTLASLIMNGSVATAPATGATASLDLQMSGRNAGELSGQLTVDPSGNCNATPCTDPHFSGEADASFATATITEGPGERVPK